MKNYFNLSRKDRIGIASVGFVVLAGIVFLNVNQHRDVGEPTNVNLDTIELGATQVSLSNDQETEVVEEQETVHNIPEPFYPNEISTTEWQSIGFSEKQAQSIVNYREKYGPFKSSTDVCKLYVVSDKKCSELSPYMRFREELSEAGPEIDIMIEINKATSEELEKIYGIGPAYAKRIVKFRNSLGGFVDKKQYDEVHGLSETALTNLKEQTTIDSKSVTKLQINTATKNEIENHPYMNDWLLISEIIKYRDTKNIENLNFLIEKELITQEEKEKLLPYIDFN